MKPRLINFRASEEERRLWIRVAARKGLSLSAFIRLTLDDATTYYAKRYAEDDNS